MSKYPTALKPKLVGTYPSLVKSGGGHFYDDVLEYRVWRQTVRNADDYYTFETFEEALSFSQTTKGTEEPLVLIRQYEWINETQPGQFIHEKGERIAEWQVVWLMDRKRGPGDIEKFIRNITNS